MTSVAGIIRFSVLSTFFNHFREAREISFDEYAAHILSEQRLAYRFDLFEKITLPSLASQTDKDFVIFIVAPKMLPAQWQGRLSRLLLSYPFLRLIYADAENFTMKSTHSGILSSVDLTKPFATFRLDDDDALSSDYIERLKQYVQPHFCGMAVSFAMGYILDFKESGRYGLQEYLHSNCSAGIAVVGGPDFRKTIFDVTEKHYRMQKRLPVITDGRKPAFIQTAHGANDTGLKRKIRATEDYSREDTEKILLERKFSVTLINDRLSGHDVHKSQPSP